MNGISGDGDILRYVRIRAKLAMKQADGMTKSSIDSGKEPRRVDIPKSPVIIDRAPIVRLLNIFF